MNMASDLSKRLKVSWSSNWWRRYAALAEFPTRLDAPWHRRARVDRLLARIRTIDGHAALFAHGHILRVLVCRWIGLPVSCGSHFLLHTASLSELGYYQGIGAVERWNVAVA